MKTSSAPGSSNSAVPPTALEIARGCLTSNLAIPGLGTVMSGRKVTGCIQLIIYFTAFGLTTVYGIGFVIWALAHWSEMQQANQDDPFGALRMMWPRVRWAFLGLLLFAISWTWALQTSLGILRKAKENKSAA
jgi:hypothetical protein